MSVTVLVCVSHGTDVKAGGQLFHRVGSKAGDKHHYLLGYFRSPETRSVLNLEFTHWLRWLTDELETCLSPPHPSAGATDCHCAPSLYTGAGDAQSDPRFAN